MSKNKGLQEGVWVLLHSFDHDPAMSTLGSKQKGKDHDTLCLVTSFLIASPLPELHFDSIDVEETAHTAQPDEVKGDDHK